VAQRKPFLLRIDPALYEALERWASDELRSVNGQIEYLLNQAVQRAGRAPRQRTGAQRRPEARRGGR
jgi:hypothetical protein